MATSYKDCPHIFGLLLPVQCQSPAAATSEGPLKDQQLQEEVTIFPEVGIWAGIAPFLCSHGAVFLANTQSRDGSLELLPRHPVPVNISQMSSTGQI